MTAARQPESMAWRERLKRLRRRAGEIAGEFLRELRRLNRVGASDSGSRPRSRLDAARRVKAMLASGYRDANRCC